jgi:hypothetical protein
MATQNEMMKYLNEGAEDKPALDQKQFRMVDWHMTFGAPIVITFLGIIFLYIFWGDKIAVAVFGVSLIAISGALLGIGLQGYVFDSSRDVLEYPFNRNIFRRQVRLSAIHDANCQVITKKHTNAIGDFGVNYNTISGNSRKPRRRTWTSKSFQVNLSGDFGARRLNFADKYKRDQFVSLLREYAPHVKITRWS